MATTQIIATRRRYAGAAVRHANKARRVAVAAGASTDAANAAYMEAIRAFYAERGC